MPTFLDDWDDAVKSMGCGAGYHTRKGQVQRTINDRREAARAAEIQSLTEAHIRCGHDPDTAYRMAQEELS